MGRYITLLSFPWTQTRFSVPQLILQEPGLSHREARHVCIDPGYCWASMNTNQRISIKMLANVLVPSVNVAHNIHNNPCRLLEIDTGISERPRWLFEWNPIVRQQYQWPNSQLYWPYLIFCLHPDPDIPKRGGMGKPYMVWKPNDCNRWTVNDFNNYILLLCKLIFIYLYKQPEDRFNSDIVLLKESSK